MSAGGLSRRSVLNGAAISVAAGVVGFVIARSSGAAKPKGSTTAANAYGDVQTGGQQLAKLDQVPVGGGLIVAGAGIVLTRPKDGTVQGFSATCTHQGCTVGSVEDGAIVCPCHGSRFDITSGAAVQGPATNPLPKVAVVVKGDGVFSA